MVVAIAYYPPSMLRLVLNDWGDEAPYTLNITHHKKWGDSGKTVSDPIAISRSIVESAKREIAEKELSEAEGDRVILAWVMAEGNVAKKMRAKAASKKCPAIMESIVAAVAGHKLRTELEGLVAPATPALTARRRGGL